MKRPTSRILSAAVASTAVIGMLTAPAAFAAPADPAACTAAEAALAAEEPEIENPALAELEARLATAQAATIPAPVTPGDEDRLEELREKSSAGNALAGQKVELIERHQQDIADAQTALDDAPPMVSNPELVTLEAAVQEACADAPPANEDDENVDEGQDARTDEDLDCGDFPLADGRTAQQVLDADPSDPHRLDADDDGRACEVDENEDTTNPGDTNQQGDTTTGGDSNTTAGAGDDTSGVYYENCAAAREAGAAPLYTTVDDGYRAGLDSDGDGVACEGGTLYNGSGDFSQTGDVPIGSAETGAA